MKLPDKTCVQCGGNFAPTHRLTVVCSPECKKTRARERQQKNHPTTRPDIQCSECGVSVVWNRLGIHTREKHPEPETLAQYPLPEGWYVVELGEFLRTYDEEHKLQGLVRSPANNAGDRFTVDTYWEGEFPYEG